VITGFIGLAKAGQRGEWMPLSIACMATSATGGDKNRPQPFFYCKNFVIKGLVT